MIIIFVDDIGRFAEIEEDEDPLHCLLVTTKIGSKHLRID